MRNFSVALTAVALLLPVFGVGCRGGKRIDYTIPGLIKALKDKDSDVRSTAATNLGKYGAEAKEAVPALIEALADKEKHVRVATAYGLAGIGPEAREAAPALRETLKDPDPRVHKAADYALQQILDPKPKAPRKEASKRDRERRRQGKETGVSRPLGNSDGGK